MSNMPDVKKRVLSLQVSRELYYQLQQEAAEHKMDMSAYVRMILNEAMLNVELTDDNKERIKMEVRDAQLKRGIR